jgi:hypothetical protein
MPQSLKLSVGRLLLSALLSLAAAESPAQSAGAVLVGIARDDSTGAPLAGVEVLLNGTSHRTETNAQGRYLLGGLPGGMYQAIYRLVGHLPARIDVRLSAGDTTRANVTLIPSAVVLSPVIVTGAPDDTRGVGIGREAFEERRRLGFGRFYDREAIRQVDGHLDLATMLSRSSGVDIRRTRYFPIYHTLTVWLAFNSIREDCVMQIYYNGAPVGRGGVLGVSEAKPVDLREFALTGLDAVEVYRSAAEVPLEYGGANAGCGVILLWSRLTP